MPPEWLRAPFILLITFIAQSTAVDAAAASLPRWGQAVALLNNRLFIHGGKTDQFNEYSYTSALTTNDLFYLDLTSSIPSLSTPPWVPVNTTSANSPILAWHTLSAFTPQDLLLFGGDGGPNSPIVVPGQPNSALLVSVNSQSSSSSPGANNSPVLFTSEPSSWANEPPRRVHHATASFGGKVYLVGGNKDDGSGIAYNDHSVFDPSVPSFNLLPSGSSAPPDLAGHTAVVLPNGTVIVFGGYSPSETTLMPFSTIWSLDTTQPTSSLKWNTVPVRSPTSSTPLPPPRRAFAATLISGNRILVHGGADAVLQNTFSDGWILDLSSAPATWTSVGALSQLGPRRDHFAVTVGGQVVFGFGYATNGPAPAGLSVFDVASLSFVPSFTPDTNPSVTTLLPPSGTSGSGIGGGSGSPGSGQGSGSNNNNSPTSTKGTQPNNPNGPDDKNNKSAAIIGVILGLVGAMAAVVVIIVFRRRMERKRHHEHGHGHHRRWNRLGEPEASDGTAYTGFTSESSVSANPSRGVRAVNMNDPSPSRSGGVGLMDVWRLVPAFLIPKGGARKRIDMLADEDSSRLDLNGLAGLDVRGHPRGGSGSSKSWYSDIPAVGYGFSLYKDEKDNQEEKEKKAGKRTTVGTVDTLGGWSVTGSLNAIWGMINARREPSSSSSELGQRHSRGWWEKQAGDPFADDETDPELEDVEKGVRILRVTVEKRDGELVKKNLPPRPSEIDEEDPFADNELQEQHLHDAGGTSRNRHERLPSRDQDDDAESESGDEDNNEEGQGRYLTVPAQDHDQQFGSTPPPGSTSSGSVPVDDKTNSSRGTGSTSMSSDLGPFTRAPNAPHFDAAYSFGINAGNSGYSSSQTSGSQDNHQPHRNQRRSNLSAPNAHTSPLSAAIDLTRSISSIRPKTISIITGGTVNEDNSSGSGAASLSGASGPMIKRSDSWWSRFKKTGLRESLASASSFVSVDKAPFEFRDPNPAPRLMTTISEREASGGSASQINGTASEIRREDHSRSVSSFNTTKTADSEAVEKMMMGGGRLDVVRRDATVGSWTSGPSEDAEGKSEGSGFSLVGSVSDPFSGHGEKTGSALGLWVPPTITTSGLPISTDGEYFKANQTPVADSPMTATTSSSFSFATPTTTVTSFNPDSPYSTTHTTSTSKSRPSLSGGPRPPFATVTRGSVAERVALYERKATLPTSPVKPPVSQSPTKPSSVPKRTPTTPTKPSLSPINTSSTLSTLTSPVEKKRKGAVSYGMVQKPDLFVVNPDTGRSGSGDS